MRSVFFTMLAAKVRKADRQVAIAEWMQGRDSAAYCRAVDRYCRMVNYSRQLKSEMQ